LKTPRVLVFVISILLLFGCQRTQVRTYPEKPYPSRAEPTPSMPPQIQAPTESGSPAGLPLATTYSEAVSTWKSYKEFVSWMEKDFSLDLDRFKRYEGKFPPARTPEETFRLRSGIYVDAAVLAKETLNRINPSYKARIVVIIMRPYGYNHYVCSFQEAGKIWIMDYGTPYKEVTGLHGPYDSLQEYRVYLVVA
jgi:hypothetical protein